MSASEPVVLIITSEFDPHADEGVRRLSEFGAHVIRWHTADFPTKSTASYRLDQLITDGTLDTGVRQVRLSEIRSVWYRRPQAALLPENLDPHWTGFVNAQAIHMMSGIWNSLSCYWISHPEAIRAAELKIFQLSLAQSLGFVVPHSLITNSSDEALEFCKTHDGTGIVYKPLRVPPVVRTIDRQPYSTEDHAIPLIYTTPLSSDHISHFDSLRMAPGLFQEYVPKAFELRITVVAGHIFTAAIYSQQHERTVHDWRRYPDDISELPHAPYELPRSLDDRVRLLIQTLGLNFGAIDMIVRPDGEYVFLEINPNGQFLWIEDLTGLPIMDTLVRALIETPCGRS
jgi:glutathione synthase/RimK-type ligase-like ATP-grasp enzyme